MKQCIRQDLREGGGVGANQTPCLDGFAHPSVLRCVTVLVRPEDEQVEAAVSQQEGWHGNGNLE